MGKERANFKIGRKISIASNLALISAAAFSSIGAEGKAQTPHSSSPDLLPNNLGTQSFEGFPSIQLLQELIQGFPNPQVEISESLNREFASRVKDLINQERQRNGLHTLAVQPALTSAAEGYAKWLVENGYANNIGHSRDGKTAEQRAQAQGYTGIAVGENITRMDTPEETLQWWMNSPGHRNQLLHYAFKDIGIGCSKIPNNSNVLCVADLGIPAQSLPIEFQILSGYGKADAAFHFDNPTQTWSWYLFGLSSQQNTLTKFEKGKIYFLHSRLGPYSIGCDPDCITIKPGWNIFVWL